MLGRAHCPAYFFGKMSEKTRSIRSYQPGRRATAERLNAAFETGDIAVICRAIEVEIRQHSVAELARRAGIVRTSLYRAFSGADKHPNFSTVLNVLDAMGLQMHVTTRQKVEARPLTAAGSAHDLRIADRGKKTSAARVTSG